MKNDIERMFLEDIREKKKAASGSFHKKGKGVKHHMSGIKTPYDFMKGKEKRELNGKVTTYNMYETLLDKEEFYLQTEPRQKELMTRWRDIYPNQKIMESLNIKSPGQFQLLLDKLEIPKKQKRGGRIKKEPLLLPTVSIKGDAFQKERVPQAAVPEKTDIPILHGLNLKYNGVYDSEQLAKIFTKMQLLIDDEKNHFIVSISIQERT